jgi:hypothetical protein
MRQVYDECREEITMGKAFWVTVLALGLMVSGTRGQSQSQGSAAGVSPNAASSASGEGMPMSKPVVPAGPLKITYGDETSEWTPATLAALPHKTITVFNEHAKVNQTYSGVELMELLKKLGVPEKPHGKEFRLYLVAEGSDGYQVVYSVGEVTPDVHDATILVADAMDGKALAGTGPVQLVATGEKRPARWVRNLVAIRVKTAE